MTTTPDAPATSWRGLADQLTPEQIAELEYCERAQIPPGMPDPQQGQLNCARAMSAHNLAQALCGDIAPPVEARDEIYDWEEREPGYSRMYSVSSRTVADAVVDVCGVQYDDGRLERSIIVNGDVEEMTATQARQLAAALIEAADEVDRLAAL